MNEPLVIYHAGCSDGWTAAWACLRAMPSAELYEGMFRRPPPIEKATGRDVYIVDFSYLPDELQALADRARSVVLLDHHKSAQKLLEGWSHPKAQIIFDMDRSGAGMAWDYFAKLIGPRPELVDYVEDADLWRWARLSSRAVNASIKTVPHGKKEWDALAMDLSTVAGMDHHQLRGNGILAVVEREAAAVMRNAKRTRIGGYDVPIANCTAFISDSCGALAEGESFAATYYVRSTDPMDVIYSLRSRAPSDVDLSEIALAYGGGGHARAAGFSLDHILPHL